MPDSPGDYASDPADRLPAQSPLPDAIDQNADESAWQAAEAELSRSLTDSDTDRPTDFPYHSTAPRFVDPSVPIVMVETAFLASAASLIFLVNYYFPIGPLLRLFFSIPIALIALRWGNRAAWMGAVVSGLLLSILMGPALSVMFVMPYAFSGVLLGTLWRRRAAWAISIALGTLLGVTGFFFRFWLLSFLLSDDLWLYATTQVTGLLEWLFIKLGILVQPSVWAIQAAILGMVVFSNLVYIFVVHLIAWLLFDRLQNPIPRPPRWVQVLMDYE